ncbi:MAG: esterase family protein [Treponema sp.]|nr:esterase family protein [Treponema sp.]
MGGYGALYAALSYPEKYAGVGCFSAACDIRSIVETDAFIGLDAFPGCAKTNGPLHGTLGGLYVIFCRNDLFRCPSHGHQCGRDSASGFPQSSTPRGTGCAA